MTYLVTWAVIAHQLLERLIAAADDPTEARSLARWIDYTLRRTPRDQGESRSPGYRIWFVGPFTVYFHVDDVAYTVRVISVGPSRRR